MIHSINSHMFVNLDFRAAALVVSVLVSMFANTTILELNNSNLSYGYSACSCVIFAMDDIEDYGVNKVQLAIMDYFISKNLPFTASIIVSKLANSSNMRVFHKVEEGVQKGLFELAIHGYRHINHTLLSREEQESEFSKANGKLEYLFGKRADIFDPPYNNFNLNTIEALSDQNISMLSSSPDTERIAFNPYKLKALVVTNDSKLEVSKVSDQKPLVYHVPFSVSFLGLYMNGTSEDAFVPTVLRSIDESIAKYGFAEVRLHPSDFPKGDPVRGPAINELDPVKFQKLTETVDDLLARNIRIASIKNILPPSSSNNSSL
jgi:peptidoglycan/xylan/chitin deacetylase (PgdA/CDA1 family)